MKMETEMDREKSSETITAEDKLIAREGLIYNLTEDLLVLLEQKNLSKAEFAKMLGKSRGHVTQLLSGSRNMTIGTLSDICLVLGVKPTVRVLPNGAQVLQYEEDLELECASNLSIVNRRPPSNMKIIESPDLTSQHDFNSSKKLINTARYEKVTWVEFSKDAA